MKKYFSFIIVAAVLINTFAPVADAAVRFRTNRYTEQTNYQTPYYQVPSYTYPTYQTPNYQTSSYQTSSYQTSSYQNTGYTYYFSPTYIAGYTYYSSPTPGYYYYGTTTTTVQNTIQQGQYYFSTNYVAGYTYYSSPTPGYYYYLPTTSVTNTTTPTYNRYNHHQHTEYNPPSYNGNQTCTIINGYYQCSNTTYAQTYSTYPGCSTADIVIGGQIWASCNALDLNTGSAGKSGWFLAGDAQASFTSYNGSTSALEWLGKQTRTTGWNMGPCAQGYRLPTRGEWETLNSYARANSTTVASLISLPQNGAYQAIRNTNGDVAINGRLSVSAAYWTSSYAGANPTVMHLGSTYAGYNTNSTDYGYAYNGYQWTYGDTGLDLLASTTGEMANVRCIRQ